MSVNAWFSEMFGPTGDCPTLLTLISDEEQPTPMAVLGTRLVTDLRLRVVRWSLGALHLVTGIPSSWYMESG